MIGRIPRGGGGPPPVILISGLWLLVWILIIIAVFACTPQPWPHRVCTNSHINAVPVVGFDGDGNTTLHMAFQTECDRYAWVDSTGREVAAPPNVR